MAGKAFFRTSLFLAAGLLCAAPVTASLAHVARVDVDRVHVDRVQATDDEAAVDDDDTSAQLAQALGCVAAYDTILTQTLAQGRDGKVRSQKMPAIQAARSAALDFFRETSDLPDDQVIAEVAHADGMLATVLQESHESLADYKSDCDTAFAPDPFADTVKSAL